MSRQMRRRERLKSMGYRVISLEGPEDAERLRKDLGALRDKAPKMSKREGRATLPFQLLVYPRFFSLIGTRGLLLRQLLLVSQSQSVIADQNHQVDLGLEHLEW